MNGKLRTGMMVRTIDGEWLEVIKMKGNVVTAFTGPITGYHVSQLLMGTAYDPAGQDDDYDPEAEYQHLINS